jgi:site-specific DNA-cytosine methylase
VSICGFVLPLGLGRRTRNPCNCVTAHPEESLRVFVQSEMHKWPLPGQIDVVVGGPPCQDFSLANTHRIDNFLWWGRNRLVQEWLEWVRIIRPKFAVMENVEGILRCDEPKMVIAQLLAWGYQVRVQVVAASSFGVPQHRKRVLIFAALHGEELPGYVATRDAKSILIASHECAFLSGWCKRIIRMKNLHLRLFQLL